MIAAVVAGAVLLAFVVFGFSARTRKWRKKDTGRGTFLHYLN